MAEALEAEIEEFIGHYRALQDSAGRHRIVRNGYFAEAGGTNRDRTDRGAGAPQQRPGT